LFISFSASQQHRDPTLITDENELSGIFIPSKKNDFTKIRTAAICDKTETGPTSHSFATQDLRDKSKSSIWNSRK
jgi:hypothetical protein